MKTYSIFIKSHCETPDYEDWVMADNKEEAARLLALRINRPTRDEYWEIDEIKKRIYVEN